MPETNEITREDVFRSLKNLYCDLCLIEFKENPEAYLSDGESGFKFDFEKLDGIISNYIPDNIHPLFIKEALDRTAREIWQIRNPNNCPECGGKLKRGKKDKPFCQTCAKKRVN